jgi:hypothetical protein
VALLTATGLSAGSYLVTFRTTVVGDRQPYQCGIAQGALASTAALVTDKVTSLDDTPVTIQGTGVLTISQDGQNQVLYCDAEGTNEEWDTSGTSVVFVPIASLDQGTTG